jgi:hypothetical protein
VSGRVPATPSPGPLETYAQAFDELFSKRGQREGFRRYLEGLLLPSERNKTLTGLANTEPIVGAQHPQAQRLQWFLSESTWEPEEANHCRLALLGQNPATAPNDQGVLVIDETGDRKWGNQTAHVGRQYLGSIGKIDNGVVSVSSLWANEQIYYPIDVAPYTPASWFEKGKRDPQFQTKPEIALELVRKGWEWGLPFRAVVADSFYGDHLGFQEGLDELGVGYVLALKPSHCWWHLAGDIGCVMEVAQTHHWEEQAPGAWAKLVRRFHDGHEEVWWVLEVQAGPYGVTKSQRLVIATTDPKELPEQSTWYLVTNLPAPGSARSQKVELASASLAEVVRLYGLRVWVEQSYKQVKQTLGWAQYQVRSSLAIRRHWQLVFCAFSFCRWVAGQAQGKGMALGVEGGRPLEVEDMSTKPASRAEVGEKGAASTQLAYGATEGAGVAGTVLHAEALLASVVRKASTCALAGAA